MVLSVLEIPLNPRKKQNKFESPILFMNIFYKINDKNGLSKSHKDQKNILWVIYTCSTYI